MEQVMIDYRVFFNSEFAKVPWGHIPLSNRPRHEPEVLAAKKQFEKILHPVCHTIVDVKA